MNAMQFDIIRSPFDGSPVGQMPVSDATAVETAINAAASAFQVMRKLPRFVRADILARAAEILKARRNEFVSTIAAEAGKPLYDARGEVARSIFNLANAAAEARRYGGHEIPLDMDAGVYEYQTTSADGAPLDLATADFEQLASIRRRVGIVVVEQDVAVALDLAKHVVVMDRGRVSKAGSSKEISQDRAIRAAYLGVD